MLPAAKHTNIVMGIDIHMVTIPPSPAPVPLPHPFIGYIFDPFDYIPILGATVHVNSQKRSNAATMGMLNTYKHIPMGAGFYPATMPLIDHEGIQFFGSLTVKAEGSYFSGAGYMMMTCSCVGIPLGSSEKYLPMSTTIPIPMGNPVFVGGPQVPDLMGVAMKLAMHFGLKFLMKKMGKWAKKLKGCNC